MRKLLCLILAIFATVSFSACSSVENKADGGANVAQEENGNKGLEAEEAIKAKLQGVWTGVLDENSTLTIDGTKVTLKTATFNMSGTYTINTSESVLGVIFFASDGNVKFDFPFDLSGTEMYIMNNNGEIAYKK